MEASRGEKVGKEGKIILGNPFSSLPHNEKKKARISLTGGDEEVIRTLKNCNHGTNSAI